MGLYCLRAQYTPDAIKAIISSGENREDAVRKAVTSVGGKLHGFYGIYGDRDGYHLMVIIETPSNAEYIVTVVSAVMGGAIAKWTTNVLYTADELVAASKMVNSSKVDYRPPSA